jgi:hypothetical protein
MENKETPEEVKYLAYYKTNAEEDYLQVPISVLRYISQLEEQDKNKYSEEDVKKFIVDFLFARGVGREVQNVNDWFEQFKKK